MNDIYLTTQTPDYVDNHTYNTTIYSNYNYYTNG